MGKFIDLTGQKFNRLIVIKRVENSNHGKVRWLCQCSCGQQTIVKGNNLKNGHTRSCGCLNKEILTKHGHASYHKSKTYIIWDNIKQRCNNSNDRGYKNYGGRGIKMCEAWQNFENFLKDMGSKPEGMSIDRIDNNGDYCPENCKWSTTKEQIRNRRNTLLITINNITKALGEWCEIYQKPYNRTWVRLYNNWTPEEALELVPRRKSNG